MATTKPNQKKNVSGTADAAPATDVPVEGVKPKEDTAAGQTDTSGTVAETPETLIVEGQAAQESGDDTAEEPEAIPEKVIVNVPKAFKLRLTQDHVVDVKVGAQSMEKEYAEHWYSKANGVTLVK